MYQRVLLASVVTVACSSSDHHAASRLVPGASPASTPAAHADCAEPVSVFAHGREQPPACSVPATTTTVDLRDAWTPVLFAVQAAGTAPEFWLCFFVFVCVLGFVGLLLFLFFG